MENDPWVVIFLLSILDWFPVIYIYAISNWFNFHCNYYHIMHVHLARGENWIDSIQTITTTKNCWTWFIGCICYNCTIYTQGTTKVKVCDLISSIVRHLVTWGSVFTSTTEHTSKQWNKRVGNYIQASVTYLVAKDNPVHSMMIKSCTGMNDGHISIRFVSQISQWGTEISI